MSDATPPVSAVSVEVDDRVLVVKVDDGKANAISHAMLADLHGALDRAEQEGSGAVAIVGRPGRFSAGFDLSVMQGGIEAARELLRAGAELALRVYSFPRPVVLGCTGHALAMGAILLMTADHRVGAAGDFKIGMNEVAIGMPVPRFAVELARDRLVPAAFQAATHQARVYDPAGAVAAGYLDSVVPLEEVEGAAIAHAAQLAATLHPTAFGLTRGYVRGALVTKLRADLDEDMRLFSISS